MRLPILVAAVVSALATPAAAQPTPTERPGRYALQAIDGGILRLDTETGTMALCTRQGSQLACEAVAVAEPDKEVERLGRENRDLRAEVKRLEDLLANPPQAPGSQARRGPKFELPTEEDVDKALNYVERMFKKFRDRLKDLEGGRSTPL